MSITFFYLISTLVIFEDSFEMKNWYWGILILKIAISIYSLYPQEIVLPATGHSEEITSSLFLPVLFSVSLVIVSVFNVYQGKKNDLVESRRNWRDIYLLSNGFAIVYILLSYIVLKTQFREFIDFSNSILITFLTFGASFIGTELKPGVLPEKEDQNIIDKEIKTDPELKKKLIESFEKEKIYRKEGLTIRLLSEHLSCYEYKLRKLINGEMGFKNFNDFLNRYRIQEACEILSNADKNNIPIIRIAMDLGYESIGPFNRAFKFLTGTTPTEFRKKSSLPGG